MKISFELYKRTKAVIDNLTPYNLVHHCKYQTVERGREAYLQLVLYLIKLLPKESNITNISKMGGDVRFCPEITLQGSVGGGLFIVSFYIGDKLLRWRKSNPILDGIIQENEKIEIRRIIKGK